VQFLKDYLDVSISVFSEADSSINNEEVIHSILSMMQILLKNSSDPRIHLFFMEKLEAEFIPKIMVSHQQYVV
jgi:hypothetical protein